MTNETISGLKRVSWLPDRDALDNGTLIAGQDYYDVYITGGEISGLDISSISSANDWLNALLPTQTGNAGKALKTDGTNTSWSTDTDTGITQLTGDVTAGPGSGSQAATLATVNSNVGSFNLATVTVNGKGLVTAASSGTASANTFTAVQSVSIDNAATNTVTDAVILNHSSSGTPAASFGTGLLFTGESTTTNNRDMGRIQSVWTTATDASRATSMQFQTLTAAGALTTNMTLDGSGALTTTSNITSGLSVVANGSGSFVFTGASRIKNSSDGVLLLQNNASSDFTRLQFGGTTSSFPSIKKNSTALNFRLADDSADCGITASTGVFSGAITPSQTLGIVGTTTNNDAATGAFGEYQTATLSAGSAAGLSTGTPLNVRTLSLTAGDWEVWGVVDYTPSGATATMFRAGVSSTSATFGGQDTYVDYPYSLAAYSTTFSILSPRIRFSLSGTTTVYLVTQSTFSVGSIGAYGTIYARRIR